MSKQMGQVAGLFNGDSNKLGDSGFTVGDMRGHGYTDAQIKEMGPQTQTMGSRMAQGLTGGALKGFADMQQQNAQRGGGSPSQISVQQAPQLQNNYDPNYLLKIQQAKQQGNGFYGGY